MNVKCAIVHKVILLQCVCVCVCERERESVSERVRERDVKRKASKEDLLCLFALGFVNTMPL